MAIAKLNNSIKPVNLKGIIGKQNRKKKEFLYNNVDECTEIKLTINKGLLANMQSLKPPTELDVAELIHCLCSFALHQLTHKTKIIPSETPKIEWGTDPGRFWKDVFSYKEFFKPDTKNQEEA